MGDMNPPDFTDLLAAFDIPDVVEPKAAVEPGQADHESQPKPNSSAERQDELKSNQDAGVSVIVKNTKNKKKEHSQTSSPPFDHSQNKSPNDDTARSPMSKFSPSAEKMSDECGPSQDRSTNNHPDLLVSADNPAKPSTQANVKHNQTAEDFNFPKVNVEPMLEAANDIENGEQSTQKLQTKLPERITNDDSNKSSSASVMDNNPMIPKVCIKTIKTKTGHVKRTVAPISSKTSRISSSSPCPSLTRATHSSDFVSEEPQKMLKKPVATAFLPVSAVKTVGSQVISLMLSDNTTVKATVIPASSGGILKSANSVQQRAMVGASSKAPRAKQMSVQRLGDLNLLPKVVKSISQMSKKGSKVKVLGSSQSSLMDAFNKALSSINPVPVYVPDLSPPSAASITLPCQGYRCLECGDSFALEKSLAQHQERRSVRIEVTCKHCDKCLVFFNKCSLLCHARSHKNKGMIMQCANFTLKPIPTDQMMIPTSSAGKRNTNSARDVHKEEEKMSTPDGQNVKCWECNEMFEDVQALADHYQQTPKSQKTCPICPMILPNECSLQSHQRLHQHKSPFVCPECGAHFQSVHSQSHHVNKICLHHTRHSGYRCSHCSVVSADSSTLKSHIQSSHCEIFYKCSVCPMAFKTSPATYSHASAQHPGVRSGEPKMIYKCAMCDTVFTLPSLLYTHLEQHVSTHKAPVFKCPECSSYYAEKQLMLDHIKVTHGALNTKSTISNNKDDTSEKRLSRSDEFLPMRAKRNNQKNASSPEHTSGEHSISVGHTWKKHGKTVKKHPCLHCKKCFCSVQSLSRHCHLKHKELHKDLLCPQCPPLSQTLSKRLVLEEAQQIHGDREGKSAWTNITGTTMSSPKRKSEEYAEALSVNCRSSDSQPLKKLKVNVLKVHKCAVCGFNTENSTTFHEHIPRHKSDGSSHQCQECGLCYTSPRSLSRHLFIVHRLKEPWWLSHRQGDESQRENQLNSVDENDDGTPNTRCKVCSRDFETERILNTHMRTHGMAFIKAKARSLRSEKR